MTGITIVPGDPGDWDAQSLAALHDDNGDIIGHVLPPAHNQQIFRALDTITGLHARHRPPAEIVSRAAVVLLADPTHPGTPFRCAGCGGTYTGMDGPPDWQIAGRADSLCPPCALAAPRHARKPPSPKEPAKATAAQPRRRRSTPRAKAQTET